MALVLANLLVDDYFHLFDQPTTQDCCSTAENSSWLFFEGVRVRFARCAYDNDRVRTGRLHFFIIDRYKEKPCCGGLVHSRHNDLDVHHVDLLEKS